MVIKEDTCAKLAQHLLPDATIQLACVQGSDRSDCGSTKSDSEGSDKSLNSEEYNERGTWVGKLDFFLSCVGYAVGLGNIWRFPYLCYRSGGGAFLIPYLLFLIICGMPLFMLELCFGQFASLGPVTVWRICPLFKGIGYAMAIVSGIVCIYYNIIISWTLYYMYLSFQSILPWETCDNWWNTDDCVSRTRKNVSEDMNLSNGSLWHNETEGYDLGNSTFFYNDTANISSNGSEDLHLNKNSPSEEFWKFYVLQISKGIEDLGGIRPELCLALFVAWIVIFFCLFRGVKSSGKVVKVSATFPYIILIILFFRGVTLPGAMNGIKFYLLPKWELLLDFKVWGDAATQIFYSVGMAWGSCLTMASYNHFHHNAVRDAMIVPVINCCTSIFAGFVVFSIIGFMSYETGRDIEDVVSHGPGLAFIVYPEAVTRLPISPLWAMLFFAMVFTVGLDTQFGMFECVISSISDEFPVLRGYKTRFTAAACVVMFFLGIPCVTKGGMYILTLMDWYCATFPLMAISLLETIAIAWVYGAHRFEKDIELMMGRKPPVWFKICWKFITPLAIMFLLFFNLLSYETVSYNKYNYPGWAVGLGWCIALTSLLAIPVTAICQLVHAPGTFSQRLIACLRPTPQWGPHKEEHRLLFKESLVDTPSRFRQTDVVRLLNPSSSSLAAQNSFNEKILTGVNNV